MILFLYAICTIIAWILSFSYCICILHSTYPDILKYYTVPLQRCRRFGDLLYSNLKKCLNQSDALVPFSQIISTKPPHFLLKILKTEIKRRIQAPIAKNIKWSRPEKAPLTVVTGRVGILIQRQRL